MCFAFASSCDALGSRNESEWEPYEIRGACSSEAKLRANNAGLSRMIQHFSKGMFMAGCMLCKVGIVALALVATVGGVRAIADDAKPATTPAAPAQPVPAETPKPDAAKPDATTKEETKPVKETLKEPVKEEVKVSPYVLGHTVKDIDGKDVNLETYKGKVLLIVNVASKCGMTPQYEGLQALYTEKKDAGFEVLGFPANNFGKQEPGSEKEIKEFCTSKYSVTFPMFAKVSVKEDKDLGEVSPLFKQLAAQPAPIGGAPEWNFTKYLIDKQGNVVAKFPFRTPPSDPTMRRKIEELLEAK
jgi:glutathione peroxidase